LETIFASLRLMGEDERRVLLGGCLIRNNRYEGGGCRRGLTLVEVVVAVVVLAFLLCGLLVPMLARTRSTAIRITCSDHLSGIGKATLLYANDYSDELPLAAGHDSNWAPVVWDAPTRQAAYHMSRAGGTGGNCTISSCFYLLVKYSEAEPKTFLCTNDSSVTEFSLPRKSRNRMITELTQLWDFGSEPTTHCSYAYQAPWGDYALTTISPPGVAVATERNPWLPAPQFKAKPFPTSPDGKHTFQGRAGDANDQAYGNASLHGGYGQNVLFLDTHVSFERWPYCGLDDDNIYTVSTVPDKGDPLGMAPKPTAAGATPRNRRDSVLVHDPPTWAGGSGR
jgi:prepilin-type N-terminal cleavage/methylation domain-containing protein